MDEEEGAAPSQAHCFLEQWSHEAAETGARARDRLRDGVQEAISALGSGFLKHSANGDLRAALHAGDLDTQDYYRELLRLVYRLILLFVAEDRDLLLDPAASPEVRGLYARFYSTARLRRLAELRTGTRHADLYAGLRVIIAALGTDEGAPALGLPPLGGFLFGPEACPHLDQAQLANADLLGAIRGLATIEERGVRRVVDYRDLGSEELGSIYESLLELHPKLDQAAGAFSLEGAQGNERRTTGSYYTPTSLIVELLDSALDPVLDEAAHAADPEAAILGLKVLDPAVGSGHFLIAAAHRLSRRLAEVRTGDEEPAPPAVRSALREVIAHCAYGIDVNPMAVELCKVSLWMEAMDPGKPLSFLDHHVVLGDSLLGTTPRLLAAGIPDDAFKPLEGDDGRIVAELRRRNRQERDGQQRLALGSEPADLTRPLAEALIAIEALPGDAPAGIHRKEQAWAELRRSRAAAQAKLLADAWCAAFVIEKRPGAPIITHGVFEQLAAAPAAADPRLKEEVARLAGEHRFLHPHLAFPGVFRIPARREQADNAEAGWSGGFDVVLGNPPWERVKLQEKEWFATRRPDIASAPNAAARKQLIGSLATEDPRLHRDWLSAFRQAKADSHLIRDSGRYPLCGRGDVNTYPVFAETMRDLIGPTGRTGVVVPSGVATDDTTKFFFRDLVEHGSLVSLFDFENKGIFPTVDSRYKFCLLTLTGLSRPVRAAEFVFFAHATGDLADPERRFTLSAEDFALLNPNTRTCPIFRTRRDAVITKAIYRRLPVLVNDAMEGAENPWHVSFMAMFHMTNDASLFRAREQLEAAGWNLDGNVFRSRNEEWSWAPIIEGKMVAMYDNRAASIRMNLRNPSRQQQPVPILDDAHRDPYVLPEPYLWVDERELDARWHWPGRAWTLVCKRVTSSTNRRTMVGCIVPRAALSYSLYGIKTERVLDAPAFLSLLDSFAFDYLIRQKTMQPSLPMGAVFETAVPNPTFIRSPLRWMCEMTGGDWITSRVVELSYTSWGLADLGADLGWIGSPFCWDPERRTLLRAELDAAFFHLYGIERDDVDYIMDTFPIVRKRDEKAFGEYRTKRLILQVYDAMARAIDTGVPYQTILDPPPADPSLAHRPRPGEPAGRWVSPRPDRAVASGPDSAGAQSAARAPRAQAPPMAVRERPSPTNGWIPERAIEPGALRPGQSVRHRSLGQGTVVSVHAAAPVASLRIRFASGEREIALGYGTLEFAR